MHRIPAVTSLIALGVAALALGACRSDSEAPRRGAAESEPAPLEAARAAACETQDGVLVCDVTLAGAEVAVAHAGDAAEVTLLVSDNHLARACGADAVVRARQQGLLGPAAPPGSRPGTLQLVLPGAQARIERIDAGVRLQVQAPSDEQRQMAVAHINDWSQRMTSGACPLPAGYQLAEDLSGSALARTPALALEPMSPPPVPSALPWTGPPAWRAPPPSPAAQRVRLEARREAAGASRAAEVAEEPAPAEEPGEPTWQRFEVVDPGTPPPRRMAPPSAEQDLPFREPSRAEREPVDDAPPPARRARPAPPSESEPGPRPAVERSESPRPERAERPRPAPEREEPSRPAAERRAPKPERQAPAPGGDRLMRDALRPVGP